MIKKLFTGQRLAVLIDLLIIFAISLAPFNWLHGDQIITGHDTGAPLIPIQHFLDRLFMWTNRWGLSADQTYTVGAFFIHGLEAFFSWLGFSLQKTEQINYVFWLLLPGLTMYYFARSVFPNRRYLPLIASVFFMLNHFLLQGWFVTERTKFSTYAAMPLLLLFIFRLFEGKTTVLKAGILSGLVLFVLNGGGNLPLFGSIFILIPFAVGYFTYFYYSFAVLKRAFLYLVTTAVFTALLSSFWLIPYVLYIFQQYSVEVGRAGGIDGVLGWAIEISKTSSFLNLMRLQGIPDWYNNPYHTYSNLFLQNPILVAIGFLIPVMAFSSWFLIKNFKERVYLVLFILVGLVGMIFAAGLHPPTGFIYELLLRYFPGFIIFRTPFYKFAPLIWLSYSILIAFFFDEILKRLPILLKLPVFKWTRMGAIAVVFGIILYNYPILDGRFFKYQKGDMRLNVPQYIFDFQKWADGPENQMRRSLLLPGLRFDNKLETYNWGYFSLATLTTLLTRETFMINAYYNTKTEDTILNSLYENLLNNEDGWEKLAALIASQNFVVRGDFKWNEFGSITRKPEDYEPTLKSSPFVDLNKVFGEWRIYSLKEGFVNPLITKASDITYVQADPSFTRYLTSIPNFDQKKPLFFEDQNELLAKDKKFYLSKAGSVYLLPRCITCDLRPAPPIIDPRGPLILPASPLYFIVQQREKDLRMKADTFFRKIDFLLEISIRRLLEAKKMIDQRNNEQFVFQPLTEYDALLKELNGLLVNRKDFDTEEGNELLMRTESYLSTQQRLLEGIFETSPNDVEKETNQTYLRLVPMLERVKGWVWRTTSENDKRYIINVDREGQYKVWLRRDPLELPANIDPKDLSFSLTINGVTYQGKPEQVEKTWVLVKSLNLKKGLHRVNLKIPPLELFKGIVETPTKRPTPFLKVQEGGVYTISAQGDKNCIVFPIKNLVSGTSYRVSFKHRRISGDQHLRALVSQKQVKLLPLSKAGDFLTVVPTYRDYIADIQLIESNELFINICTVIYRDPIYTQNTNVEVSDISVRKLASPIFVFEGNLQPKVDLQSGVSFNKINQTKYKIRIDNAQKPFFLTFSQRFSPDWKIYFDNPSASKNFLSIFTSPSGFFSVGNLLREPLTERNHFISNTYANTWYIDKKGDSEIVVEYKGQLRFYVAFLLSLAVLAGSVTYILISRRKIK